MSIWKHKTTIEALNATSRNTLSEHVGIEITAIGDDYLEGTLPVDHRTHQPYGILHGGASVVLAETLGSLASVLCAEAGSRCVGLEINANHIKSVASGIVIGRATPLHIGRMTQVWEIKIRTVDDALVAISRITVAVLPKKG